jgi:DNA-directed RNA polymerase subunit K/omega
MTVKPARSPSRSTELDLDLCVANAGGNRYDLIIQAAARARQIAYRHKLSESKDPIYPAMTALLEIQNRVMD